MLPIYSIIDYSDNRYLLSKAVMKRARQINFLGDDNLEEHKGKIVSLSLQQVFEREVKFRDPKAPKTEG
jgi:DNA-directed RNA polymerase subunit K/omega